MADMGDLTPRDEGLTTRHVRIAAAVGAVVLVAALAVAIAVTSSGGDGGKHAAAVPASTTTVTVTAPAPATSATPSGTSSSAPSSAPTTARPTAPTVAWKGTLSVNGPAVKRDLDTVPPSQDPDAADLTADWLETILKSQGGAQLAPVSGHPDAAKCRDAAAANGSDKVGPLHVGDVVCVATSGGHVARLTTVEAHQTSVAPTLRFSAVVWQFPGGGQ